MLVNIIVAVCENFGVGLDNRLPWRLPNELKYFQSMTTKCKNQAMRNAVIMGRKTFESIPPKFRPLKGRLNVVLSRDMRFTSGTSDFLVARSLQEALEFLRSPFLEPKIETAWVCGGSSIYKETLDCGVWNRLYVTRIHKVFKCDAFFPSIDFGELKKVSDESVPSEEQAECGIGYHFEVYENSRVLSDDESAFLEK